jgi:uncharacterized protein (TIGR02271 family)
MATRTITALFDNGAEAERAVQALVSEAGVDRSAVRVEAGAAGAAGGTASGQEDKGFFASLRDMFIPEEDHYSYAEGIRRGGVMVSAQVDDARIDRAMDVLERHGAVDLDEREAAWRREGWTGGAGEAGIVGASSDGYRTGTAAMPGTAGVGAPDGTPGNPPGTMASRGVDQVAGTNISGAHPENERAGAAATARTGASAGSAQGEERIPIVEERLQVGKREVNRGRVRLHSRMIERPVQEQVTLREERVDVERRPVSGTTQAGALGDPFQERTIEVEERGEEAVVSKEARVVEEVVVRKEADQRTETVSDTVRKTEVDVEDERGNTVSRTGTTDSTDRNR